ncbi:MAG TPA: zinc-dependent metalloprotease family protein [Rudaea sp.]|nr:zinc-dependent metalloprotease family protein [Rudaea sp.]
MPRLAIGCVTICLAVPFTVAQAQTVWTDRSPDHADVAALSVPPRDWRALTLDVAALRVELAGAPPERSSAAPALVELPMPDGSTEAFAVRRSAVMAPALAARHPAISSYVARALARPEVEARLDDSPHGFSAMIRAPEGVMLLQPVAAGSDRYLAFRRDALGSSPQPFTCLADGAAKDLATPLPQTSTGATVRTYRLALAATGEYTQVFGGTVEDGMAALVQAVNRVNGIYLTDFAVEFELVANNDRIVYTDAQNDPYTNTDPNALLTQNQSNLDSVIGTANYDIGHVVGTGGGGLAQVGVTCNANEKAMGETGSSNPNGDAFWVDYLAHELGHQLGALHSFNGTGGHCSGNRSALEAAEPGSGSTIMSYAGICAGSDLQPHSDAYFHAVSLAPIASRLAGTGATCGVGFAAANHAPVVAAVPDHTVPAQTPFALMVSAADADGDTLTYAWEETDLGNAAPPEGDDGTRPLFRSFAPATSPVRLVPELARILVHDPTAAIPSGGQISGESWATTTRDLHFRATVRDNHPGGGASASTDATVHVSAAAGPFRVTAPAGGVLWIENAPQAIAWDVAGTDIAPVSCAAVDVLYSADGGRTFTATLASAVPNTGAATVTAPNLPTATARMEVRCSDNIFFDISPGDFSINADEIFVDGFDGS